MDRIRTAGIPLWLTGFLLFIFVFGTFMSVLILMGMGPDPSMTISFGGRNLGLALISGMAVFMRSATLYVAALAGGLCREISDLWYQMASDHMMMPIVILAAVFIVIEVIGIRIAWRAR